jgi:hypothetical protein
MNTVQWGSSFVLAAVLVSAGLAVPVRAQELGTIFADGQSVGTNVLAEQRGGTEQTIIANQISNVANNSVGDYTTTGNAIISNSFGGSQGMFSTLVNTGNNVAMQSQLIINVNLQ